MKRLQLYLACCAFLLPLTLYPAVAQPYIASGDSHTCVLLEDMSVRCWGLNDVGQLGYGNTDDIGDDETPHTVGPVNLGAGRTAMALAAGREHTCALLDDGSVRCWGEGDFGRLGYGNTDDIGDDETPDAAGPVNLGVGRTAIAIAAGGYHTCAILDDGSVRCWGEGQEGRLGYSNTDDIGDDETPDTVGPVSIGVGRTAKAIAAGGDHTCVILDDDTVLCWGAGDAGRLGYNNTDDIGDDETPDTVGPVSLGLGRTAKAITADREHTCVILDDDTVRCWGEGDFGRLGYGNTDDIGDDETPDAAGPVNLGVGRTAKAISAGVTHTCAILDDDTVKCWGEAEFGQLGYGNMDDIGDDETPDGVGVVNLGAGRTARKITAGQEFTCAVLDNRTVRCWGEAWDGQLGYGDMENIGDDETPDTVGPVWVGDLIYCGDPPSTVTCGLYRNTVIQDIVVDPLTGDLYAASFGYGVLFSDNGGACWKQINTDLSNMWVFTIEMDAERQLFIGTWADGLGGVWRADAEGMATTWSHVGIGRAQVLDIRISPFDDEMIFAGGQSAEPGATPGAIWYSLDDGDNWDVLSDFSASVWSVAFDADDPTTFYAGLFGAGICASYDSGNNWEVIGDQFNGLSNGYGFSLLVGANGSIYDDMLLAGTADGVWIYDDILETWSRFGTGSEAQEIRALAMALGGEIYAGTWGWGVLAYDPATMSWSGEITDLPLRIMSMAITTPLNGPPQLLLATDGSGVHVIDLSTSVDTEAEKEVPSTHTLYPNYPNPFNPATTIRFALPDAQHVQLEVFDMTGRQVRQLVDQVMPSGTHDVVFDASGLPSGAYLYRLKTAQATQAGMMMLVK